MNDIVKVSNLLNKLVQIDPDLNFYHFGWLNEINENPANNFNKTASAGRLFPSLDWIVPERIINTYQDPEKQIIKMDLFFSDLYGYNNKGVTDTRSKIETWRDILKIAQRFILYLDKGLCELEIGGISSEQIEYELNGSAADARILDIKVTFEIVIFGECFDINNIIIPEIPETCDLENFCKCQQI